MSKFIKPAMPPLYKNVFEKFPWNCEVKELWTENFFSGISYALLLFLATTCLQTAVHAIDSSVSHLKLPSPCRLGNKSRVSVTIHIQVQTLKKEDTEKKNRLVSI